MATANRIASKVYLSQINELQSEKNKILKEM